MKRIVAVVICSAIAAPFAGATRPPSLLSIAARRSGLTVRRPVRVDRESKPQFDANSQRAFDRAYPLALQRVDDVLYAGLGLITPQRRALVAAVRSLGTSYDADRRVLRVRRAPAPRRSERIRGLIRALVDQNFGLRRLDGLRGRDRDRFLAAEGVVDGISTLTAGIRARAPEGSPLERFVAAEQDVGPGPGRTLVSTLRSLGAKFAVSSALRTFPRTTEQLLHVDKFLERERALPIELPKQVANLQLQAPETFGELDLRGLLRAFGLRDAATIAAGWGGGRLALYSPPDGEPTVALTLRWDTPHDVAEWQRAVPSFVAAAFPGAKPAVCPAVAGCWLDGPRELAVADRGDATTFASGPAGELVAAILTG